MERLIFATVSLAILADLVSGHGHMTLPPSRNGGRLAMAADCMKGECMWFSQPDAGGSTYGSDSPIGKIKGEPTLNAPELRTYNIDVSSGPRDYTRHNPWRAPGSAPVIGSGCGRGGGGGVREGDGGTAKEFGLTQNMDGTDLPPLANHSVSWTRGTVQEVAWANNANHGGGYAYRLCKKGSGAWEGVSEECFQRNHLDFDGSNVSFIQWTGHFAGNHSKITRVAIPRVTAGGDMTTPKGSMWARVPIPACQLTGSDMGWPADQCSDSDCAACCATVPARFAGEKRRRGGVEYHIYSGVGVL